MSHATLAHHCVCILYSRLPPRQAALCRRKPMSVRVPILALLIVAVPLCATAQANRSDDRSAVYYPDTAWQHKTPRESGVDPGRLKEAIDFAVANETRNPRDLVFVLKHYRPSAASRSVMPSVRSRTAVIRRASSGATSSPNGAIRCASI
jgi:hypothetical protein